MKTSKFKIGGPGNQNEVKNDSTFVKSALDGIADLDTGAPWMEYPAQEYLEQSVSYLKRKGIEVTDDGEYAGPISHDGNGVVATPNQPDSLKVGDTPPSAGTAPTFVSAEPSDDGYNSPFGRGKDERGETTVEDLNEGDGHEDHMEGDGVEDLMEGGGDQDHQPEVGVWGKTKWGEARWGGDPDGTDHNDTIIETGTGNLEANGHLPSIVATNRESVRRIRANPTEFKIAAVSLLRFLDDLESGAVRTSSNADPLTGNADRPQELTDLLREIRDELRRFNDLLEKDINSPELEKSTHNLRKMLYGALGVFGGTLAFKMAGLLAPILTAYLLQFGYGLGLPPIEQSTLDQLKDVAEISEKLKKD